jgi:hypothetical protein
MPLVLPLLQQLQCRDSGFVQSVGRVLFFSLFSRAGSDVFWIKPLKTGTCRSPGSLQWAARVLSASVRPPSPNIERPSAHWAATLGGHHAETSPPRISASGSGCCRAAGVFADRKGASLPDSAGASGGRISARWPDRYCRSAHGQYLSDRLSQPFVIENRPGAGSNIATEAVIKSPPDGYTLLLVASANAINSTLYDKLSFNFIEDTAPVAPIVRQPFAMEVNLGAPAMTVSAFVA